MQDVHFELLQQWQCVVQDVSGSEFTVVLHDLSDPSRPEEEAVIGIEEISEDDLPLLQPGAVIYWSIGYETSRGGQVKRVSVVKLRRLPAWSRRDIQRVEQRVRHLMTTLGVDDDVDQPSRVG